jgi:hypothetical protein
MKLRLSETREWELLIPPAAAAERLAARVDRVRWFRMPGFSPIPFEGIVTAEGFRLRWISEGPGFSVAAIFGIFEPTAAGTRVRIRFGSRIPLLILFGLFLVVGGLLTAILSAEVAGGERSFSDLIPPLVFVAIGCAGILGGFRFRLAEVEDDLRRSFDGVAARP